MDEDWKRFLSKETNDKPQITVNRPLSLKHFVLVLISLAIGFHVAVTSFLFEHFVNKIITK